MLDSESQQASEAHSCGFITYYMYDMFGAATLLTLLPPQSAVWSDSVKVQYGKFYTLLKEPSTLHEFKRSLMVQMKPCGEGLLVGVQ